MDVHACVIIRPLAAPDTRIMLHVITIIAVIVVWLAGHSLPDAILAAAGAGWATAVAGRQR